MPDFPRISCLLPTTGARRAFVKRALHYFNEQEYPDKELVVIDSGTILESLADDIPHQSNIQYVYVDLNGTDSLLTIGAKRNLACSLATGEVFCHWDDDDYYGPRRLSEQVAPLLANKAEVTAYQMSLLLDVCDSSLWRCSNEYHARLFSHNVRSGTLMYDAVYWHTGMVQYPNMSRGEDVFLLHALLSKGARLSRLTDSDQYISVRHGNNVSDALERFAPDWWQVPMEHHLPDDSRAFYQAMSEREKVG